MECKDCGHKTNKENSFCPNCGKKKINKKDHREKSSISNNKIGLAVLLSIIILFIFPLIMNNYNTDENVSGNIIIDEGLQNCPHGCCEDGTYKDKLCQGTLVCENNQCVKDDCPHECCEGNDYKIKSCGTDYFCSMNTCQPKDTDKDMLYDYEERLIGTEIHNPDSDGDTLSDHLEHKIKGTDPLNKNTDSDRYDDNIDENPLVVNTARISTTISNRKSSFNLLNIGIGASAMGITYTALSACTAGTLGACAAAIPAVYETLGPVLDLEVYETTYSITFFNGGNDYTDYVKYNIIYYNSQGTVSEESGSIGKLNEEESEIIPIKHQILVKDIPKTLWDMIVNKDEILVKIGNLGYQTYP